MYTKTYQSDPSIHTKVKHITKVEVVYNKHTCTGTSTATATTITRHEFTMQVPAHTILVKDSKQVIATTSTLLRYTIVVAPDTASQGPSSATLHIANCLRTPNGV